MTIAFRSIGTVGTGTTSVTAGLPASLATGDAVLLFVETKPDTATFTTPTGWTLVADVAGGGGTTGASVGPTRQAVFFREKDASWSAMPAVTVTNGNSTAAAALAYSKAAGTTWATAAATGTYGSAAATTNGASTLGSNPGLTAGDWCVVGYSSMVDTPTWSGQGISATGVSAFGTVQERSEAIETNTGNDVGGMVFDRPVTTGTATAAPTINATASIATRGTVALVRLREVAAPVQWAAAGTVAAVSGVSGAAEVQTAGSYSDAFTRADQALGATGAWVPTNPTASELQIVSNQLAAGTTPAAAAARYATAVPGSQRSRVQVVLSTVANFGPAVAMNAFAANTGYGATGNTWYLLRRLGANLEIAEKNSGASTYTVRATVAATVVTGDYLELTYDGTTLVGYLNDVQTVTYTPVAPITGQDYIGVALSTTPAALAPLGDNWTGGVLAGGPTSYPTDGTVAATSGVTGAATALLVVGGTVAGTSAATGATAARLAAAGSVAGTTAATGATTARLAAAGSVAATSTAAGSAGVVTAPVQYAAAGTVAATSTTTGSATALLPSGGAVAGTSAVTGSAGSSFLAASGSAAAVSTVSAAATSRLPSSGTVAATSTTSASATSRLPASGSAAVVSGTTAVVTALLPAAGSVAATSSTTGGATTRLPASGTVAATSDTAGSAELKVGPALIPAAGTVAATSGTTGAAAARLGTSGTVAATSTAAGSTAVRLPSSGTVAATSGTTGSATIVANQYPAAGTVAATSGTSGSAGILRAASGTVSASSGASASATLRLSTGGTVAIGSGTSAAVTQRLVAAGVVEALTALQGSAGSSAIIPPANPEHTLYVAAEPRTYVVAAEDTTLYVAAEQGLVVAAEDPTYYVAEASRVLVAI